MTAPAKLLIADSQKLFSSALATALGPIRGLEVLDERGETWTQAAGLIKRHRPDVAILDYWMAEAEKLDTRVDSTPQVAAVATLAEHARFCRLIILSGAFSPTHMRSTLSAGAAAYLPRNLTVRELAEAVRMVHSGAPLVFSEELFQITERLEKRLTESNEILEKFANLSSPELEVLLRRSLGRSPDETARDLYVSRATVNARTHSILRKTGSRTMAEALAQARRAGLLHG